MREVTGPWLRLTALGASAATLLAVVSGAAHLGTAHRLLAALALPPLVARAVAALVSHRRLVPLSLGALGLFGAAALAPQPRSLHLAAAAVALAVSVVLTAAVHRQVTDCHLAGSWRDYVALTKTRIMSLLLLTG